MTGLAARLPLRARRWLRPWLPQAHPLVEFPDWSVDWPHDGWSLAGVVLVIAWFWIGWELLPWL